MTDLPVDLDDPRTALVLALADDDLVMGHRALHWTGFAPSLEEDIAFSGIAQDEINHADVWYQLVTDGSREQVDALGLGREPGQYRHAVLCEHEPRDFSYTLARHWFYDHADMVRLTALTESSDPEIAALSRKLTHEERYHVEHADTWFWRLVRAEGEVRDRFAGSLREAFGDAPGLFEPTVGEEQVLESGVLPEPSRELLTRWLDLVGAVLEEAGLADVLQGVERDQEATWTIPPDLYGTPGGRHGEHTAAWDGAWQEMTELYRAHPGASW